MDLESLNRYLIIEDLKKEIRNNPDHRHRIILRAIKTAESKEVQKVIREFCKSGF